MNCSTRVPDQFASIDRMPPDRKQSRLSFVAEKTDVSVSSALAQHMPFSQCHENNRLSVRTPPLSHCHESIPGGLSARNTRQSRRHGPCSCHGSCGRHGAYSAHRTVQHSCHRELGAHPNYHHGNHEPLWWPAVYSKHDDKNHKFQKRLHRPSIAIVTA